MKGTQLSSFQERPGPKKYKEIRTSVLGQNRLVSKRWNLLAEKKSFTNFGEQLEIKKSETSYFEISSEQLQQKRLVLSDFSLYRKPELTEEQPNVNNTAESISKVVLSNHAFVHPKRRSTSHGKF